MRSTERQYVIFNIHSLIVVLVHDIGGVCSFNSEGIIKEHVKRRVEKASCSNNGSGWKLLFETQSNELVTISLRV